MAWRDRLQPASFRGVAFEYQSDDLGGIGRRNVVHEYPKRDTPYVEDMGRSVEEISLEAIVIGQDYLTQLDELLKALRAEGPGELVHPFYGRLQVVANPNCRVRHSFEDGGLARISMSFTEAGKNEYPTGSEVPALKVVSFADRVVSLSTTDFASIFNVGNFPSWVSTDALTDIGRVSGALQTLYRRVTLVSWESLLGNAGGLAGALVNLVSSGESALGAAKLLSVQQSRAPASAVASSALQQSRSNGAAIQQLATQAAIAEAARQIVAAEEPVYDDLQMDKRELVNVIDRELDRPGLPQSTSEALADLRGAVSRYVLEEASTASRLVEIRPATVTPAAVLAYDLYEDASRSEEITRRNGLAHPGFVPPTTLKVLNA